MRAQVLVIGTTLAAAVLVSTIGPPAVAFSLRDSRDAVRSSGEWRGRAAVVLLFVATDCPISNRYAPTIRALAEEYGERNVAFYGVHSDPDVAAVEVRSHSADFGLEFPMLLDPGQSLASRYGVTVTPTAVVVSAEGTLLYRGRIDDRGVDLGKWREVARRDDLREAIAAALFGRKTPEPFPEPVGCYLPSLPATKVNSK